MAKVTAKDRKEHSATGDGRFPIKNKAQAKSAIRLRGHAKGAARKKVLRKAAKYAPKEAAKARAADEKKGK